MKKIKQQNDIYKFLISEIGKTDATLVFEQQAKNLNFMIENMSNKTPNQQKVLSQTILPRIALYKALSEKGCSGDDVEKYIRRYMIEVVGSQKHKSMLNMEKVPGFYSIYSNVFLKIMKTTDLQVSTQQKEKNKYNITITKCLWHTACVENGCPELCRLFCDVDDVTYANLKKIGFSRTTTLGYGGTCCDFHFFKK